MMADEYDHTKPKTWAARVKARTETFPATVSMVMALVTDLPLWGLIEEFVLMSHWERCNALYALAPIAENWVKAVAQEEAIKARQRDARVEVDWENMEPWHLFHHLWGKATNARNYNKAQWKELETHIPHPRQK